MIPPLPPTFDAALRDVSAQQPRFRGAAAARLAEPPADRRDEAVEGLLSLAKDPVGAVREAAYESLGTLGASEALSRLLEAFEDEHMGARQTAVLAVGRVAPEAGVDAIAALLDDRRPEMRFSAIWTLSYLGAEHADRIARALDDRDDEVRTLAMQCLGELGATASVDAIARALDDASDSVRFAAASSLASLGDARGAPTLRAALSQPDRAFAAAVGLGDLADRDSLPALTKLAKHRWRSPILRAAAARALVRLGDPAGAEVIRRIVRSWRIEARQYGVELVGELGLASLLPDLTHALRKSRKVERPVYETTLEQLAPKSEEAKALLASLRQTDHLSQ
ncbi:MAG: HEAT repeat domain-containing protein [Polyangiales bacterium]